MGKLAKRRRCRRAKRLWNLAQHQPDAFKDRVAALLESWCHELRRRARQLDGPSATTLAEQALRELATLFGIASEDLEATQNQLAETHEQTGRIIEKLQPARQGIALRVRGPRTSLNLEQLGHLKEALLSKANKLQRESARIEHAEIRLHEACDHLVEELPSRCCFELAQAIDRRMYRLSLQLNRQS